MPHDTLHIEPAGSGSEAPDSLRVKIRESILAVAGVEQIYPHEGAIGGTVRAVAAAVREGQEGAKGNKESDFFNTSQQAVTTTVGKVADAVKSLIEAPVSESASGAGSENLTVAVRVGLSTDADVPRTVRSVAEAVRQHVDDERYVHVEAVNY